MAFLYKKFKARHDANFAVTGGTDDFFITTSGSPNSDKVAIGSMQTPGLGYAMSEILAGTQLPIIGK